LRLGPERPRDLQRPSPFKGESRRLEAPVGMRHSLDHSVAFQEVKASRQGRLVDGELIFELP